MHSLYPGFSLTPALAPVNDLVNNLISIPKDIIEPKLSMVARKLRKLG